ncbi:MAG: rhodanese-like domain-containing protein [Candidatus Riflebacteria bacterium]|nr:rhodanese-like domain-containing protein [Candidatus Riflebacteria bacterium]
MTSFFEEYGLHIAGIIHLSPREAHELANKGAIVVDVRDEMEMNGKKFTVPNLIYLPSKQFSENFASLPKDKPLILADSVGLKSKEAILFLMDKGYTNIANLNGGIIDWEKDKLPTEVDDDEILTGQCACKLRPKKVYRPKGGC